MSRLAQWCELDVLIPEISRINNRVRPPCKISCRRKAHIRSIVVNVLSVALPEFEKSNHTPMMGFAQRHFPFRVDVSCVYLFSAFCDVRPAVHIFKLVVKLAGINLLQSEHMDGFRYSNHEV